jgi:hypothetical protein
MKRLLPMLTAFLAMHAGADTLGDMKTALGPSTSRAPIQATYSIEQLVKSEGRFGNENTQRVVSAEVADGPTGVSITIPHTLLDKVSRARNQGDDAALNLIGAIRTISIVEALDFRDELLTMLENATVRREERVLYHGVPARKLALTLKPRRRKESGSVTIGSVKVEDQMDLWIGDDHLPIAAERHQKTVAGFMFIHGTFEGQSSYTFAHAAGRLIVARLATNGSGNGMGQNIDQSAVETLTVH